MELFSKNGKKSLKYQRCAEDSRDSVPDSGNIWGRRPSKGAANSYSSEEGAQAGRTPASAKRLRPRGRETRCGQTRGRQAQMGKLSGVSFVTTIRQACPVTTSSLRSPDCCRTRCGGAGWENLYLNEMKLANSPCTTLIKTILYIFTECSKVKKTIGKYIKLFHQFW